MKSAAIAFTAALIFSACGLVERVPEVDHDTVRQEIDDRTESTRARLAAYSLDELDVVSSRTVTLERLHQAGIMVGSEDIDCDQPLHVVVFSGLFDSDDLFSSAIRLAGGTEEALAMRLVAEIYDPETEMPLGMIGDSSGGTLGQISGGSFASGASTNGTLMLDSANTSSSGHLLPEAVCRSDD